MKQYDVIVLGAGFGGLVAAALLSHSGQKVLVVDKHNRAGGFATCFKRHGYTFEVAVHMIEGPSEYNLRTRIFDKLGIYKRLNFLEVPHFFRWHFNGQYLDVPCRFFEYEDFLKKRFPEEASGIHIFFHKMKIVFDEFIAFQSNKDQIEFLNPLFHAFYPNISELLSVSVSDFISSIIKNAELRWLLIANIGFYHHDVSQYSIVYFFLSQYQYLSGGAQYVQGGTQKLSDLMVDIITENGGTVFLQNEVVSVDVESEKITQVYCQRKSQSEPIAFCGDQIIVNMPPLEFLRMINREQADGPIYKGAEPTLSATTLYMGLKRPLSHQYPLGFFNFFAKEGPSFNNSSGIEFSLVDYSVVDKSIIGRYTADLVYLDRYADWKKDFENGNYYEKKNQVIDHIIDRLKRIDQSIESNLEVFELGTPLTVERFTGNTSGAVYGFNPSSIPPSHYFDRLNPFYNPQSQNLSNVYYASAWSSSHGLTGVSVAGFQSAYHILKLKSIDLQILAQ